MYLLIAWRFKVVTSGLGGRCTATSARAWLWIFRYPYRKICESSDKGQALADVAMRRHQSACDHSTSSSKCIIKINVNKITVLYNPFNCKENTCLYLLMLAAGYQCCLIYTIRLSRMVYVLFFMGHTIRISAKLVSVVSFWVLIVFLLWYMDIASSLMFDSSLSSSQAARHLARNSSDKRCL